MKSRKDSSPHDSIVQAVPFGGANSSVSQLSLRLQQMSSSSSEDDDDSVEDNIIRVDGCDSSDSETEKRTKTPFEEDLH